MKQMPLMVRRSARLSTTTPGPMRAHEGSTLDFVQLGQVMGGGRPMQGGCTP